MSYFAYNRVSSKDQNEDRGNTRIQEFCDANHYKLEKIFVDKQTGKNFDRARYKVMKEDVLRSGDTLIISEYDRLGRAEQTKKELEYFKEKGIRVIFLDIPTTYMDLSSLNDSMANMILTAMNDMLISFYDCMARTELERKQKRQREGYEELKKRGEWDKLGRPRKMSKEKFAEEYKNVVNGKMTSAALRRKLNLNEDTFFRYVREYRREH